MKLTKEKKRQIRRAIVSRTFSAETFGRTAGPLVRALSESEGMARARKAAEESAPYINPSSSVRIQIQWKMGRSADIPLPFIYAKEACYADLIITASMDESGRYGFLYTGWKDTAGLPDLNGELRPCLEKVIAMIDDRERLAAGLEWAMERISSPRVLAEKIPAAREFLKEELQSLQAQSKALIPQDIIDRLRACLGKAGAEAG